MSKLAEPLLAVAPCFQALLGDGDTCQEPPAQCQPPSNLSQCPARHIFCPLPFINPSSSPDKATLHNPLNKVKLVQTKASSRPCHKRAQAFGFPLKRREKTENLGRRGTKNPRPFIFFYKGEKNPKLSLSTSPHLEDSKAIGDKGNPLQCESVLFIPVYPA